MTDTQTPVIVTLDVPMNCTLTLTNGEVTHLALIPLEADAGYFGPETDIIDGSGDADYDAEVLAVIRGGGWYYEPLCHLPDGVEWVC